MDFHDYSLYISISGLMTFVHKATGDVLISTEYVSLDTLIRLAVTDNARRKGITL